MGHRREQVASAIHKSVQQILVRGLADPRIRGLITVTQVEVSPDLRDAVVHVSILPEERQILSMQGLVDATMKVQHMLNNDSAMRRPPHISFRLDERLKKQASLLAAIRQGVEEDEQRHDENGRSGAEANSDNIKADGDTEHQAPDH